jgi:hypothetical protein
MTRRAQLPTIQEVRTVIAELTEVTGKAPAVLAVARRLGLANTTFRRNFPDIADELQGKRQATASAHAGVTADRFGQLKHDNEKLRRDNHQLNEHLDLACANIQRLTWKTTDFVANSKQPRTSPRSVRTDGVSVWTRACSVSCPADEAPPTRRRRDTWDGNRYHSLRGHQRLHRLSVRDRRKSSVLPGYITRYMCTTSGCPP